MNIYCERCGMNFKSKKNLIRHLEKDIECLNLFSDITRQDLLVNITKKKEYFCDECNKKYKTHESLRRHKCIKKLSSSNTTIEDLQKKIIQLQEVVSKLSNNNTTLITNSITNNITVNINSLTAPSFQQIEYILNSDDFKQQLLKWITSKNGIFEYIDTKFYNPEHPENQMIKSCDNKNGIELHIYGKWKKYDNMKGSDLILTNVGNDFDIYIEVLKEHNSYKMHKKKLLLFKDKIVKPLEWGTDITDDDTSVDSSGMSEEKEKIQKAVINHIHTK